VCEGYNSVPFLHSIISCIIHIDIHQGNERAIQWQLVSKSPHLQNVLQLTEDTGYSIGDPCFFCIPQLWATEETWISNRISTYHKRCVISYFIHSTSYHLLKLILCHGSQIGLLCRQWVDHFESERICHVHKLCMTFSDRRHNRLGIKYFVQVLYRKVQSERRCVIDTNGVHS
jgi:hypothetical protein